MSKPYIVSTFAALQSNLRNPNHPRSEYIRRTGGGVSGGGYVWHEELVTPPPKDKMAVHCILVQYSRCVQYLTWTGS
jgi:hypothetical protein